MIRFIAFLLIFSALSVSAKQKKTDEPLKEAVAKMYRYRVMLTDKAASPFSVSAPEQYLSPKSIARRTRLGIAIDEHDLPINPHYLDGLRQAGTRIVATSKWQNTAMVEVRDVAALDRLKALPYVKDIMLVYETPDSVTISNKPDRRECLTNKMDTTNNYYGAAQRQVEMLGVQRLHEAGFRGEGMTIAVIDGGFNNTDCITALSDVRILGTKNFVRPETCIYDEQAHGMMVLSCIATNRPYQLVGTAPAASFYLLQSEDAYQEYPGEEDFWCAAVEYADSVGCDIITSSLGYMQCDSIFPRNTYTMLDGKTHLNSREASMVASRGLLLLNSAGNSGDEEWKKIGFPADATDILTVGAVKADGENTIFSSIGYTADHRVKPDVMAMGGRTALLMPTGEVGAANGTSFSCPTMCGAVTCLWQAFPNLRPEVIMDAVRRASHNYDHPDEIYGYGIPDMWRAYELLKQ